MVPEPADEVLVESICSGERQAFEVLYDRYFVRVYRFLDRRMANRADVEETTQEVFASLFSSLESYRGDAPFAAWVFGLTRRTLASRYKRKRASTVPLLDAEDDDASGVAAQADVSSDPHAAYEFQERIQRLQRAAERELTKDQWELFRLHHLEHRSIEEIAHSTSRSADAVKSHLYRARKILLAR
jgi:RNA polymerase sigma-70 factor (ECF subfamily)